MIKGRVLFNVCPYCGKRTNQVASRDGTPSPPEPGDLSVCFGCARVARFGAGLKLESLTPGQTFEAMMSDGVPEAVDAARAFILARHGGGDGIE